MHIVFIVVFLGLSIWGFAEKGPAFTLFCVGLGFLMFMGYFFLKESIEDSEKKQRESRMTPEQLAGVREMEAEETRRRSAEQASREEVKQIGFSVPKVICPHCQTKGQVFKKDGAQRRDTTSDTSNLTAAVLHGTKTTVRKVNQLHCKNCTTTWDV
jgi:hypothetical protein